MGLDTMSQPLDTISRPLTPGILKLMTNRLKELEVELDTEQRRLGDSAKNLRKSERRIQELDFQVSIVKK